MSPKDTSTEEGSERCTPARACCRNSKARFTRATTPSASANTLQAVRAFTLSTACVKYPVDSITVAVPLLSLEDRRTYWRQQNHVVVCERGLEAQAMY